MIINSCYYATVWVVSIQRWTWTICLCDLDALDTLYDDKFFRHETHAKYKTIDHCSCLQILKRRKRKRNRQREREEKLVFIINISLVYGLLSCLCVANVNEWRNNVDFSIRSAVHSFSINRLKSTWVGAWIDVLCISFSFSLYVLFVCHTCISLWKYTHFAYHKQ